MSTPEAPKIAKWPFIVSDIFILLIAGYVEYHAKTFNVWVASICTAAVAFGGWLCVRPYLEEYWARLKLSESANLVDSLQQITQIESVASQISSATGQWQTVNDHAAKSVTNARELWEKMQVETRDFRAFLERANDIEKSHLRLEVDKLKRGEGEWLHILVRVLDNTYALYIGAVRSRQAALVEQITQFQAISRDAARRVGLVPFAPNPGDPFDPRQFETVEGAAHTPDPASVVGEVLATGYTYQGQLLRRPLVVPTLPVPPEPEPAPEPAPEPPAAQVESHLVPPEPVASVHEASEAPVAVEATQVVDAAAEHVPHVDAVSAVEGESHAAPRATQEPETHGHPVEEAPAHPSHTESTTQPEVAHAPTPEPEASEPVAAVEESHEHGNEVSPESVAPSEAHVDSHPHTHTDSAEQLHEQQSAAHVSESSESVAEETTHHSAEPTAHTSSEDHKPAAGSSEQPMLW